MVVSLYVCYFFKLKLVDKYWWNLVSDSNVDSTKRRNQFLLRNHVSTKSHASTEIVLIIDNPVLKELLFTFVWRSKSRRSSMENQKAMCFARMDMPRHRCLCLQEEWGKGINFCLKGKQKTLINSKQSNYEPSLFFIDSFSISFERRDGNISSKKALALILKRTAERNKSSMKKNIKINKKTIELT